MILTGKVVSGLGVATKWVKKIEEVFYQKTGTRLYSGTLNIKLPEKFNFVADIIIEKEEFGGTRKGFCKKM